MLSHVTYEVRRTFIHAVGDDCEAHEMIVVKSRTDSTIKYGERSNATTEINDDCNPICRTLTGDDFEERRNVATESSWTFSWESRKVQGLRARSTATTEIEDDCVSMCRTLTGDDFEDMHNVATVGSWASSSEGTDVQGRGRRSRPSPVVSEDRDEPSSIGSPLAPGSPSTPPVPAWSTSVAWQPGPPFGCLMPCLVYGRGPCLAVPASHNSSGSSCGSVSPSDTATQVTPQSSSPGGVKSVRFEWSTVMLRNLPNDYTRECLIALLDDAGFEGCYDFVYVPTDFRRGASYGYAFVNMISNSHAQRAFSELRGFTAWKVRSVKVLEVCWGNPVQGFDACVERYRNSPVMAESVPESFKPLIIKNGVRQQFPKPDKSSGLL